MVLSPRHPSQIVTAVATASAFTTIRLAREVENIAGIKEASGDMAQCMQILRDKPENFLVVSGDDALTLPQIACGMEGVISVAANALPRAFTDMVRASLKGDFKSAKKLNDQLIDAWSMLIDKERGDLRGQRLPSELHRYLGSLLVAFVQWHSESWFRAYGLLPGAIGRETG